MSRTISVFYDCDPYTLRWLRALVWADREFKTRDFKIDFQGLSAPLPAMNKYFKPYTTKEEFIKAISNKHFDIVFLAFHHSLPGLGSFAKQDRIDVLNEFSKRCNRLIWLDTADSTGTALFDVLPYVDKYLKKQLLVDKSLYEKPIWGGQRLFCEYYRELYKLGDEKVDEHDYECLQKDYVDKLGLSWNVGLGDLFTYRHIDKFLFHRRDYVSLKFTKPSINRKYDVHFRGSIVKGVIGLQRKMAFDILNDRDDIVKPDIANKVSRDKYIEEIKNSRTIISPYGWGEICGRDFEAFLYGTTLIKPDMSHLETYPNIYQNNKTYIPIKWDFSDFNDVLDYIITDEGKKYALKIAVEGQKQYRQWMQSAKKRQEFADHIISQIQE